MNIGKIIKNSKIGAGIAVGKGVMDVFNGNKTVKEASLAVVGETVKNVVSVAIADVAMTTTTGTAVGAAIGGTVAGGVVVTVAPVIVAGVIVGGVWKVFSN